MSTPNRFRFRAWDNIHKVMIKACTPLLRGGISSELLACTCSENDGLGPCDACDGIYGERAIIMQSTGLCDKNGKEIFEGDIVDVVGAKNNEYPHAVIKWYDFWAAFMVEFAYPDEWFEEIHRYNLIVIGNIYENQELLQ